MHIFSSGIKLKIQVHPSVTIPLFLRDIGAEFLKETEICFLTINLVQIYVNGKNGHPLFIILGDLLSMQLEDPVKGFKFIHYYNCTFRTI